MTATPLLRAGTFDLEVIPAGLTQPPPKLAKRSWEGAEDAALRADAIPRCALRPDCILQPVLQHVVVLVRRCVLRRHAREHPCAHGREEFENVWGLGFFGVDDGRVSSGRVRTYSNRTRCR